MIHPDNDDLFSLGDLLCQIIGNLFSRRSFVKLLSTNELFFSLYFKSERLLLIYVNRFVYLMDSCNNKRLLFY